MNAIDELKEHIGDQTKNQQTQYYNEHGTNDFGSPLNGNAGAHIVSGNAAQSGGDTHNPEHLTGQGKGSQTGNVGGGVCHLGIAGGGKQIELA